jgi:hypothetical protein
MGAHLEEQAERRIGINCWRMHLSMNRSLVGVRDVELFVDGDNVNEA